MARHRRNTFANPETTTRLVTDPDTGTTQAVTFITDRALADLLPDFLARQQPLLDELAKND